MQKTIKRPDRLNLRSITRMNVDLNLKEKIRLSNPIKDVV
ncbi:hypothetical protein ES702_04474 [subsurface metagenome]